MSNRKITYFLVIIQAVLIENKLYHDRNSFVTKLVNVAQQPNNRACEKNKDLSKVVTIDQVPKIMTNFIFAESLANWRNKSQNQDRFVDSKHDASQRMRTRHSKSAVFDLITGEDDSSENDVNDRNENDGDDDDDDDEKSSSSNNSNNSKRGKIRDKGKIEEEEDDRDEDEDEDESDTFSFLSEKAKIKNGKIDDDYDDEDSDEDDGTPKIKHIFKKKFKLKDFIYLLLIAYKLKFVTLIPLLLGAKILLVGAMSMAGFFFALFSAALGLQTKSHH